jgi:hypothetical protein
METFVVDCPQCKAKVAAELKGLATEVVKPGDEGGPYGSKLYVGVCPRCRIPLAGESLQIGWEGHDAETDLWSNVARVYPKPNRTFSSPRIPRAVTHSLVEASQFLQADAHTAACVMFGHALEALCRDVLGPSSSASMDRGATPVPKKQIMLAEGIRRLKDENFIDERLYNWSEQLHAFRNMAAHPGDFSITREDAEDLQSFVYAIVEFVYDLADRYAELQARLEKRAKTR